MSADTGLVGAPSLARLAVPPPVGRYVDPGPEPDLWLDGATTDGDSDAPDGGRLASVRSAGRLLVRLLAAAALFTLVVTLLPVGRPDGSVTVAGGGAARPGVSPVADAASGAGVDATPTGIANGRVPSTTTSVARVPGLPPPEPIEIDLVGMAQIVQESELEAEIAAGLWVEPEIEPESQWVDAGNGVRLPDLLLRIRFCESTNNYGAANGSSSARGAYQFLTGSWEWYGHAERTGVAEAHLASPAQQDQAALATYRQVGARPWAESRPCWGADDMDPRYATAKPPATTTTAPPTSTSSPSSSDSTGSTGSTAADGAPTTTAPPSTTVVADTAPTSPSPSSTEP